MQRRSPRSVDVDETDFNENLELPGADLSGEELTVRVLPKQEDEFTCSSCFLVQHRTRLAGDPRRPAALPRLRRPERRGRSRRARA